VPCQSLFLAKVVVVESLVLDSSPQPARTELSRNAANNDASTARFCRPLIFSDFRILFELLVLVIALTIEPANNAELENTDSLKNTA
jgi:hypothetical protein